MKIDAKVLAEARKQFASQGGKARAAMYDKKTLRKWGKKGGRPKKGKKHARKT